MANIFLLCVVLTAAMTITGDRATGRPCKAASVTGPESRRAALRYSPD
jgi:hypothetical protein